MKRLEQFDTYPIDVSRLYVAKEGFNCRGYFTTESVSDLAKSIQELGGYPNGLQIPIVVQPIAGMEGFDFRLIAGHRRVAACTKFLKWTHVPGQIRADLTEEQARLLNFTENLERSDLNLLEEARAIENTFPGQSCRDIAEAIKRPTRWVLSRRALLTMPEEIQAMAAAGWLLASNIEVLARMPLAEDQLDGAKKITAMRQAGKRKLPRAYRGEFRFRLTKNQLRNKLAELSKRGVYGGMLRMLAYAAAHITDEDLEEDIKDRLREQEILEQQAE